MQVDVCLHSFVSLLFAKFGLFCARSVSADTAAEPLVLGFAPPVFVACKALALPSNMDFRATHDVLQRYKGAAAVGGPRRMRREVIASYPFMVSQARFFDGQNRSFSQLTIILLSLPGCCGASSTRLRANEITRMQTLALLCHQEIENHWYMCVCVCVAAVAGT